MNQLEIFLKSINPEAWAERLLINGAQIIGTILLFLIGRRVAIYFIDVYFKKLSNRYQSKRRAQTLRAMSTNIVQYFFYFLLIYSLLALLGVPVATLLAGAGIASIAIGIGAQGLVNDMVNGFFVLLERQYEVGDSVSLGDISGTISKIGLKTTIIQGYDGSLNFIPNRKIDIVQNYSRHPIRAQVDLPYFVDTDLTAYEEALDSVLEAYQEDLRLTAKPQKVGLYREEKTNLLYYRVRFFTQPGQQESVTSSYYGTLMHALRQNGISLPENLPILNTQKEV